MALNLIQVFGVLQQFQNNLYQLQYDMRANAQEHRRMALDESFDLAKLQQYIADSASEYARRVKWVSDFRSSPWWPDVKTGMAKWGWDEADIDASVNSLFPTIDMLTKAQYGSREDIIQLMDTVEQEIPQRPSLWPE